MLNSKQRAYLRSLANKTEPIVHVGKTGVNENLIKQIDDALEAREIVKITVLNNSSEEAKGISDDIANSTNSEVVQVIGKKITLYRKSKKTVIVLP
ncbi:MAG: ribosome assembly RNA-binding protein YhbY [Deltaproteobacteria bacterium]